MSVNIIAASFQDGPDIVFEDKGKDGNFINYS